METIKNILMLMGICLYALCSCADNDVEPVGEEKKSVGEESKPVLWEISLNSNKPVIEELVDGIRFKFCLLNEQGVPANKFKEGENFSFHFEMTNQEVTDSLCFRHGLICELVHDGFGRIISGHDTTSFFQNLFCAEDLRYTPFYGEQNHYEETLPVDYKPGTTGYVEPELPSGVYSTEFTHTFEFAVGSKRTLSNKCKESLIFKINFEIE